MAHLSRFGRQWFVLVGGIFEYFDLMDAKTEARAELVREKEAGLWQDGEDDDSEWS